jgi:hypothetical protein
MVRFLVVEPIHSGLNSRFDMGDVYLRLIILSVIDNIPVDNDTLLVTDFINLKIKSVPSFEGACCTTLLQLACPQSTWNVRGQCLTFTVSLHRLRRLCICFFGHLSRCKPRPPSHRFFISICMHERR